MMKIMKYCGQLDFTNASEKVTKITDFISLKHKIKLKELLTFLY